MSIPLPDTETARGRASLEWVDIKNLFKKRYLEMPIRQPRGDVVYAVGDINLNFRGTVGQATFHLNVDPLLHTLISLKLRCVLQSMSYNENWQHFFFCLSST